MINPESEPEDKRYEEIVHQLGEIAKSMLTQSSYCERIIEFEHAAGMGYLEIFKVTYESRDDGDGKVWVLVGAYPYAILERSDFPTVVSVLEEYTSAMEDWVAVRKLGGDTADCIYVRSNPTFPTDENTPEFVDILERRLRFLRNELLPEWRQTDFDADQDTELGISRQD